LPAIFQAFQAILDRGADRMARIVTTTAFALPGGVLVHCHAGRDRTGLVIALALTLAGVPDTEIARDHALSASCLRQDTGDRTRRLFAQITEATMRRTLIYLSGQHGGVVPYLGVDESVTTLLRTRLTEPSGEPS
jgi:protein tyrosine/serine phosphatase